VVVVEVYLVAVLLLRAALAEEVLALAQVTVVMVELTPAVEAEELLIQEETRALAVPVL
jgi:hypothetical protein